MTNTMVANYEKQIVPSSPARRSLSKSLSLSPEDSVRMLIRSNKKELKEIRRSISKNLNETFDTINTSFSADESRDESQTSSSSVWSTSSSSTITMEPPVELEREDVPSSHTMQLSPKHLFASDKAGKKIDDAEKKDKANVPKKRTRLLEIFFLLAAIPVLLKVHRKHGTPMGPGDSIGPREVRHSCGMLRFLPTILTSCRNLKLENGSSLSLKRNDGTVLWQLYGNGKCEEDDSCAVTMRKDGMILIGGKVASFADAVDEVDLTPWPFAVEPKNGNWRMF